MELFRDMNSGNLEMKESWSRYLIWIHWSDEYHHHTKWGEKNSLRRTHASMHGRTHNIKAIFEDHSRWYNKMTLILLSSIHSLILCMCLCVYRVQAECECVWVCLYVYVEREKKTSNSSKANRIEIKQRYLCEPAEWERRKQDQTVLCTVRPLFVLSSIYVYSLCALSLVFFILLLFFIIIFKKKEKSVHVRYWILRSVLIFDGGGERERRQK